MYIQFGDISDVLHFLLYVALSVGVINYFKVPFLWYSDNSFKAFLGMILLILLAIVFSIILDWGDTVFFRLYYVANLAILLCNFKSVDISTLSHMFGKTGSKILLIVFGPMFNAVIQPFVFIFKLVRM